MTKPTTLKTFLWFDGNLGEALEFYAATFTDFVLHSSGRPEADGKLMTAEFAIHGHEFIGMGWPGGPKFTDAISLALTVDGQDEVDRLWDAITKDGQEGQCGWCKDPFGVSWQVTPIQMGEHTGNPDPAKAAYAWSALRKMKKIVIQDFIEA
jgi:predicted 3-demethylubiquinone-9 3-methyltransferase (glyoxalase superfamily)